MVESKIYEVEVDKNEEAQTDKWDTYEYRFFLASSMEEALVKARKIYGDKVRSVERSNYVFHLD